MKKLLAIGEALIDFIPMENGRQIKNVEHFHPCVGGAPANVCGAFNACGGKSDMITQLGNDPFGDKIVDEFSLYNIGCDKIIRTDKANTSLAFVSLMENGNREFSFYRKPGADMLLSPESVKREWFDDCAVLHFSSVSLGEFPMKDAHKRAIIYAKEAGSLISFDPNVRFALWDDHDALRNAILEFIVDADILKVSDEEIGFISGKDSVGEAVEMFFDMGVKMVVYTKGGDGCEAFTRNVHADIPGIEVFAIDTTGAGDGFIGSFLYQLVRDDIGREQLNDVNKEKLGNYLKWSNKFCARSVTKHGAIASYPIEYIK